MQYIRLVNFVDICSNAFLHVLDESVNNIDRKGNLAININRKTASVFNYYLSEEILRCKRGGTITMFFNTCRPALNWRKMSEILPPKYFVNDESVLVNPNKLELLIDSQWELICRNKQTTTLIMNVMDSIDIENVACDCIGKSFIAPVDTSFKILCDGNKIYHDSLLLEIPDYLNNEMKIQLRTHGIT